MLTTAVGLCAAFCTTVSYFPQVLKCWKTRETKDLSLRMLILLAMGLTSWVIYGLLNSDWVIVGSNLVSLGLLANVLGFKIAEVVGHRRAGGSVRNHAPQQAREGAR